MKDEYYKIIEKCLNIIYPDKAFPSDTYELFTAYIDKMSKENQIRMLKILKN